MADDLSFYNFYLENPLLLPQDKNSRSYDGFLSVNDETFRLSINQAQSESESMQDTRINCSWKLWNILQPYEDVLKQRLLQSEDLSSFIVELKTLVEKLLACQQKESCSLPLHSYSLLTAELEAIGWEKLTFVNESFSVIKLKTSDCKAREHIITLHISDKYPDDLPKCSVDVPDILFHAKGCSKDNVVQSIYQEFCELVKCFEDFWDMLDEIDQNCWIIEPEHARRADVSRRIALGSNISLHFKINPHHPRMLPECHLMGADSVVLNLRETMNKNLQQWNPGKSVLKNLEVVFEMKFPSPQTSKKEDYSVECGICYAYKLDNAIPENVCDDPRCGQPFHSSCLYEWLRALPSSRQSFNIIFGECPYCNKGITVKVK